MESTLLCEQYYDSNLFDDANALQYGELTYILLTLSTYNFLGQSIIQL